MAHIGDEMAFGFIGRLCGDFRSFQLQRSLFQLMCFLFEFAGTQMHHFFQLITVLFQFQMVAYSGGDD